MPIPLGERMLRVVTTAEKTGKTATLLTITTGPGIVPPLVYSDAFTRLPAPESYFQVQAEVERILLARTGVPIEQAVALVREKKPVPTILGQARSVSLISNGPSGPSRIVVTETVPQSPDKPTSLFVIVAGEKNPVRRVLYQMGQAVKDATRNIPEKWKLDS